LNYIADHIIEVPEKSIEVDRDQLEEKKIASTSMPKKENTRIFT